MWVEIIATSVTTVTAAHLVPRVFDFLTRRFTKVKPYEKAPTPESPPLGDYVRSVEKLGHMSKIKINVSPAKQRTVLGKDLAEIDAKTFLLLDDAQQDHKTEPNEPFCVVPPNYNA
jgi:hypothetical protein